jgi:hypothetical protein
MVAIGLMLAGVTARASADQASPVVPPPAATDDQARVVGSSRSVAGFKTDRGGARRRDGGLLVDFVPAESGEPAGTGHKSTLDAGQKHTVLCCDFWIFDAWVELFDDVDRDGYHTYFRVGFDVDTGHADADVYVKLFLRGANGVWNLFYESGVFPIFGTAGGDDYEVETELVAGYPRDDYDILIEVYDAYYDELVVEYGPAETSALSYVPLEDLASDGLVTPPVAISSGGGGGALSIELLILLLAFTAMSMRRPRAAG